MCRLAVTVCTHGCRYIPSDVIAYTGRGAARARRRGRPGRILRRAALSVCACAIERGYCKCISVYVGYRGPSARVIVQYIVERACARQLRFDHRVPARRRVIQYALLRITWLTVLLGARGPEGLCRRAGGGHTA